MDDIPMVAGQADSAEPDWSQLNRIFYEADPADYFEIRSTLLLLYAAHPDGFGDLLSGGLSYGAMTVTFPDGSDDDDAETVRAQFVATEAQILYHHTIEALLRMYLAHREPTRCPWIGMASLRVPGDFKKLIEDRFVEEVPDEDAWREEVARTFLGRAYEDLSEPRSRTAVESIEMTLRVFAKDLLDDAHPYNAAKHGLAVNPMPSIGLTIGNVGKSGPLHHAGPAFQILEYTGEPRTWKMTTRWVDPEQTMAYQRIAVLLLRSVWSVGKVMHTDTTQATIFNMPAAIYDLAKKEGGFRFDRFSIGLGALLSAKRQPPEASAP